MGAALAHGVLRLPSCKFPSDPTISFPDQGPAPGHTRQVTGSNWPASWPWLAASSQVTPCPFVTPVHTQHMVPVAAWGVLRRLEARLRGTRGRRALRLSYPVTNGVSYTSPASKPLMSLPVGTIITSKTWVGPDAVPCMCPPPALLVSLPTPLLCIPGNTS